MNNFVRSRHSSTVYIMDWLFFNLLLNQSTPSLIEISYMRIQFILSMWINFVQEVATFRLNSKNSSRLFTIKEHILTSSMITYSFVFHAHLLKPTLRVLPDNLLSKTSFRSKPHCCFVFLNAIVSLQVHINTASRKILSYQMV